MPSVLHAGIGVNLGEHPWLRQASLVQIDDALADVTDPDDRLPVCRLAARALETVDAPVGPSRQALVLDHTGALARHRRNAGGSRVRKGGPLGSR